MKKILVFIDWYLPGFKAGGPIRSVANMVTHLSHKYEFLIITRNTDYLENKPYLNIESNKWIDLSENQKVYYCSKQALTIKKIRRLIKETEFDIAYINGIYSFYFSILPLVLMRYFREEKVVVAPRGMLSAQGLGVKSLKKKVFVFIGRIIKLYKKSIIHVTADSEKKDIEALKLKQQQIYVVPNLPPKTINNEIGKEAKKTGELKLVSIARISPEKNTLFALECLSNYSYTGDITFDLFGTTYDLNYWEKCKKFIEKMPSNIKVRHAGSLDNDLVNNTLQRFHFLFLPSKGENFGHSILESFMAACPVIISNKTPWQNLEKEGVGWDISLDSPKLFSQKIQEAVNLNAGEYLKMSENAKKYYFSKVDVNKNKLVYYDLFT